MYQKILCDMDGVSIYGVISICIFFGFFTGMLLWAFALKQSHLKNMGNLPLDDGARAQTSTAKTPSTKL